MTYPAHEGLIRISSVHGAAIRKEIGERLRIGLNRISGRLPPRLARLISRLRDDGRRDSADPSA
jgi:hypothetical protein